MFSCRICTGLKCDSKILDYSLLLPFSGFHNVIYVYEFLFSLYSWLCKIFIWHRRKDGQFFSKIPNLTPTSLTPVESPCETFSIKFYLPSLMTEVTTLDSSWGASSPCCASGHLQWCSPVEAEATPETPALCEAAWGLNLYVDAKLLQSMELYELFFGSYTDYLVGCYIDLCFQR